MLIGLSDGLTCPRSFLPTGFFSRIVNQTRSGRMTLIDTDAPRGVSRYKGMEVHRYVAGDAPLWRFWKSAG